MSLSLASRSFLRSPALDTFLEEDEDEEGLFLRPMVVVIGVVEGVGVVPVVVFVRFAVCTLYS